MPVADELKIIIRAETAKAVRAMRKAQSQSRKTETSFLSLAKKAGSLAAGYASVTTVINSTVSLIKSSSQAASDAEETFAKFSTVFRDLGDQAPSAMKDLAESFDLADSTAARLLGNTGDLLTGFGLAQGEALELSDATTRLAIDLASFTNAQGGAEAVSRALTSAYAGEREALKTYGIVINEAAVKARVLENEQKGLTHENQQQARAFATLQLAQEQSTNAIGDYARTADSTANVQRQLNENIIEFKENLGESINEGVTPMRAALNDLFETINTQADARMGFDDIVANADDASVSRVKEVRDLLLESADIERRRGGPAAERQAQLLEEQAAEMERILTLREKEAESMEYVNDLIAWRNESEEQQRKNAEAAAAAALAQEQLWASQLEQLDAVYARTDRGQRERIESTIRMFEGFVATSDRQKERIATSIAYLQDQLESMGEEAVGAAASLDDVFDFEQPTFIEGPILGPMPEREIERFKNAWVEAFESINDQAQGGFYGGMQSASQKIQAVWTNGFSQIGGMAMQTFSMMGELADQRAQNEIASIQKEIEALEGRHEQELAWAEAAGATEEELAEMKAAQLEEKQKAEEKADEKEKKIKLKQFQRNQALSTAQTIMSTAQAVVGFLANPGGLAGIALSSMAGALGATQLGIIQSTPPPAFEKGGSFVTNGPQMIQVGDGQSPRERVTVEPLSGPYSRGGGGGRSVVVNVTGVIDENIAVKIKRAIERAEQRGAA